MTATHAPVGGPLAAAHASRGLARAAGIIVFVAVLGFLIVMPLYRLQQAALAHHADGYTTAFTSRHIGETLRTTLWLTLGSVAIGLLLGVGLAWASMQLPHRLRFLRLLPILPIVVPAVASVIGWSVLLSPRIGYLNVALRTLPWWHGLDSGPADINTLPWIVILTGLGLTSFVYVFVSSGLANVNHEMLEAAYTSGAGPLRVFFRVTLPLLRPVLIYGTAVALLLGLGQFTAPLLLGRNAGVRVITTEMYYYATQTPVNYGAAAALATPLIVLGLVLVLAQKVVLRNQSRYATHGGKAFRSVGRPSYLAAAAIFVFSLLATLLPIVGLVIVGLSPFWSEHIRVSAFTLKNFHTIFGDHRVVGAITTSLVSSLAAVALTLPIGFIAASMLYRRRARGRIARNLVDYLSNLPLGVPAVVFGVAFFLTYTQEPLFLYGSRWVLILVYVTLMIPFAVRMQLAGMVALGDSYLEASRTAGAGVLLTARRISAPLLRPAIGGAAALMFVLLSHEFTASLLVRSPSTQVMGTVLYDYYLNGSYGEVAAIALVMTLITTAGVAIALVVGGTQSLEDL